MLVRFLMLAILVTVAAAFAMPEVPQIRALWSAVLASAVLAAAVFTSSPTVTRLARRLRLFLILALAAPAAWMALQLIPIPIRGLGNPIWETASAALNTPLAERLTVDIRATVQSLLHYNAIVALALVTAVVALDRQRAWQLLSMLVSIATIASAYSVLRQMTGSTGLSGGATPPLVVTGAVPAVLGLLLSAAMIVSAFEERRRVKQPSASAFRLTTTLSFALPALLICLATVLVKGGTSIAIAAVLGTGIVLAVFAIRNWFYGVWGTAGVLATTAVLFLAAFTLLPIRQNTDLTIALSGPSQAATERMLQDTGLAGSGAGTFAALLPIHRDIGAIASRERPTAAAAIAIEMGRTFLYGLFIMAALGAWAFLSGSLRRGYDYVYAAIGSGAAISLAILALVEDGILEFGASLLAAALFGLAVAQSQSSTVAATSHSRSSRAASGVIGPVATSPATRSPVFGSAPMRVGLGLIAVALITQLVWLLAHPGILPIGSSAMSDTPNQARSRTPSNSLRSDGELRPGNLPFAPQPTANETAASHQTALNTFAQALRYSPLRGDLWLMLAAISKEQKTPAHDVAALLKLSYYTAPNDLTLLPLRLTVALGASSALSEPELRELVQRDVKIAFANQPTLRPALVAAYESASADGKTLVEHLVSDWDPIRLQGTRKEIRVPAPGTENPPPSRTPGRADSSRSSQGGPLNEQAIGSRPGPNTTSGAGTIK